jgi:hypothetical protein
MKSHGGRRADLDNRYFRSSWEANYARYLNWLKGQGQIRDWQYEAKVFTFPIKRGTTEYRPDFLVTESDGTVTIHEVKGYMDDKSRVRLDRMKRYYPDVKILLIDSSVYKGLEKLFSRPIDHWEKY